MLAIVRRKTSKVVSLILFIVLCLLFAFVIPIVIGSGATTPAIRCSLDKSDSQSCACDPAGTSAASGVTHATASQDKSFHVLKGQLGDYRRYVKSLNQQDNAGACTYRVTYRLYL